MNEVTTERFAPTVWIKVRISNGMFNSEKAVYIPLSSGVEISIFADNSILNKKGNDWYLQVTKIKECPDNKLLVLLPTEAFETSSRWAEVNYKAA